MSFDWPVLWGSALPSAVLGLVLAAAPAAGADWTQFRGSTGQGHFSEGPLPVRWSNTEGIRWSRRIAGRGWSSPVVSRGRIYLTTAVSSNGDRGPDEEDNDLSGDQSLRAVCLSIATGEIEWDQQVFAQSGGSSPAIHEKNSHASPTPIVVDDRLYVHFGHQGTACLDLRGNILWQNRDLPFDSVHGNGGSPLVVDDMLVFHCDGSDAPFIVALDARTGEEKWRTQRPPHDGRRFSFSTPLLIHANGRRQIVSPASGAICSYDVESGEEIWRVRHEGFSVVPRPVYGHGLVFVSTGYMRADVLAIRPDGQGDVTETHVAWKRREGAPRNASMLLVDSELFAISDEGVATCADARSGRLHWKKRLRGDFSASPIYAGGLIYFQNEQGDCTIVRAHTLYEEVASNSLGEASLASFAAAENCLLIRTESRLYCVEAP